jgi:WD40 repeat protein
MHRREFGLACGALLAGTALRAAPMDDAELARKALRLVSADLDCIDDVAFSPDRAVLALAHGSTDSATVWDTATGKWLATLTGGPFRGAKRVALVDGGRTLVLVAEHSCLAWDVKYGRKRMVFGKNDSGAAAASPDGSHLATVHDGGGCHTLVRVRDLRTTKEVWSFNNAGGMQIVHSLAFSPDSKQLALGTQDGKIKLMDAASGKLLKTLRGESRPVLALDWAADGKRLAATWRDRDRQYHAVVWDVAGAKEVGSALVGPKAADVTLAAGGALLAVDAGESAVALWDAAEGKLKAKVRAMHHRGHAWSPDVKSLLVVREYPRFVHLLTFDTADLLARK